MYLGLGVLAANAARQNHAVLEGQGFHPLLVAPVGVELAAVVVIAGCESGPIRIAKWIGHQDNNVAEYVALMEALQCAVSLKATALHVYSDSQVVVRQMRGEYICRSSRLYSLHWTCLKLARALSFSISHVPREDNAEANQLANTAVRERIV